MMIRYTSIVAPFALALACLSAAPAQAETDAVQMRFSYRAAELATPAGADHLYRRIETAARRACASDNPASVYAKVRIQRCRAELVDLAVEKVGNPVMAAIHGRGTIQGASR